MASSSQLKDNRIDPLHKLKEAHHKGWLAGVALRLGCGNPGPNPYDREGEEWIAWENGFEEGYAG